jgi:tRNA(Ile2)-agmatinylcytidine synthase
VKNIVTDLIDKYHYDDENTNPGMVLLEGKIPVEIQKFALKVLTKNISIDEAKKLVEEFCSFYYTKGNGRGLIGGLAAIGNQLDPIKEDFTFELLAYRTETFIGTKRKINETSVFEMDNQLTPYVFNNIDSETNKILICPAGKDPVFFGIRGEKADDVLKALSLIKTKEPIQSYCIFRTNQGTDQHFKYADSSADNYSVFKGRVKIYSKSKTITGGHVFLKGKIQDNGKDADIAAFEPTKSFKNIIKLLLPGDIILAYGGVKEKDEFKNLSIHLEKCEIILLSEQVSEEAPFCPNCSKRMTSDGYLKGYKCRSCGYKNKNLRKTQKVLEREIEKGLYIPPEQAQRHLVKPLRRYSIQEKTHFKIIDNWWKKYSKV